MTDNPVPIQAPVELDSKRSLDEAFAAGAASRQGEIDRLERIECAVWLWHSTRGYEKTVAMLDLQRLLDNE